jgi:hypothetical protein
MYEYLVSDKLLSASEELNSNLQGLTAKVLELGEGQTEVIVDLKDVSVLVQIDDYAESDTPSFETVKSEVIKDFNEKTAKEQTEEKANSFFQTVKSSENIDFANLVKDNSLKIEELKGVKSDTTMGGILQNYDIKNSVFRKSSRGLVGEKAFINNNDYIVIFINNISLPQVDKLTKPIEEYLNNAKEENFELLRTALLKDLKAKSTIDVVSGLITQ